MKVKQASDVPFPEQGHFAAEHLDPSTPSYADLLIRARVTLCHLVSVTSWVTGLTGTSTSTSQELGLEVCQSCKRLRG